VGEERARANNYRASLRRLRSRPVRLVELPVAERPAVLKAYLSKRAYSKSPEFEAREFFGVSPNASLDDLAEIADRYPVFRIEQMTDCQGGRLPGKSSARDSGQAPSPRAQMHHGGSPAAQLARGHIP
jgi:hypothetical protein